MTRKQVITTIKNMKLRCTYDADTEEYRVAYMNNKETTAYYTNDADDAIGTAKLMLND